MNNKKILFIAYTFPPIPYGGTYRALRLCRGFAEKGIECHVLTIKEYRDIPNDYLLLKKVPSSVVIHRTRIVDPWRRYQGIKKKFVKKIWFRIFNKFISFSLRFITFPDHMLFWAPFAVLKARKVIKDQDIGNVLISSPPDSSQLIGWILKKWLKVRWIADFRDPIYGNVAQVHLIDPVNLLDKIHKKLLIKYDKTIAKNADLLISNTVTHSRQLQQNYSVKDVQVIRNSYDSMDYSNCDRDKFPILTIAHVGSIYGKRNPDLLFAAVQKIATEYAPKPLRLQIVFLGLGGDVLRENIEKFEIQDYVKIEDQVPHHKAIEFMCRAHLLLLIKATGKWSKGQIPGKFFEYIGSRNPVLCIGPKESEVASLMLDHKLGYVVEDNLEEMTGLLRGIYMQYLQTGAIPMLKSEQIQPFSSAEMVEKMVRAVVQE